jgi:hypothetical protein
MTAADKPAKFSLQKPASQVGKHRRQLNTIDQNTSPRSMAGQLRTQQRCHPSRFDASVFGFKPLLKARSCEYVRAHLDSHACVQAHGYNLEFFGKALP